MPAIQLARLNAEVQYLARQFSNADRFAAGVIELFERYASWSFRRGEVTYRRVQLPQYNLPDIVMQKLAQAIRPLCQASPAAGRAIAEALWGAAYFETRQFAITILALLPSAAPEDHLKTVQDWLKREHELLLVRELLSEGCRALRTENVDFWLRTVESWLESKESREVVAGLQALIVSINDPSFAHLPHLFRLATPLLIAAPSQHYNMLLELVEVMILRAPSETSFFLQQLLLRGASRDTARIIRRKLSLIPKEIQPTIRAVLTDLRLSEPNE